MKDLSSIPAAPAALPLIGHLIPLCHDPLKFMNSLPVHGDLVRIRLGSHIMVVICTSEMTREVLVRDKVFDKGGPVWERTREFMGGNSILNAPPTTATVGYVTSPSLFFIPHGYPAMPGS